MSTAQPAPQPITREMTHGGSPHGQLPPSPSALSPAAESLTFIFGPGVKPGKFGKMFRRLRALDAPEAVLTQVGKQ